MLCWTATQSICYPRPSCCYFEPLPLILQSTILCRLLLTTVRFGISEHVVLIKAVVLIHVRQSVPSFHQALLEALLPFLYPLRTLIVPSRNLYSCGCLPHSFGVPIAQSLILPFVLEALRVERLGPIFIVSSPSEVRLSLFDAFIRRCEPRNFCLPEF